MDRKTVIGLSAAGVRRRTSGGSANRSQRSQQRARTKALNKLQHEFFMKTGVALFSDEATTYAIYDSFARRAESIQKQVLFA